jgi:hypothetical protein
MNREGLAFERVYFYKNWRKRRHQLNQVSGPVQPPNLHAASCCKVSSAAAGKLAVRQPLHDCCSGMQEALRGLPGDARTAT